MTAEVLTMEPAPTWDDVREEYSLMETIGHEAVLQAMRVGQMLIALKAVTPYREFQTRVSEIGIEQRQSSRLMTLARHRVLIEKRKPVSQAQALALIPKKKQSAPVAPSQEQRRDPEWRKANNYLLAKDMTTVKPRPFTDREKFNMAFYDVSGSLVTTQKFLDTLTHQPQYVEAKKYQDELVTMERYVEGIHDNIRKLMKQERELFLPCGTPTGKTARISDAEQDRMDKEIEKSEKKNAKARARREEEWKKADAEMKQRAQDAVRGEHEAPAAAS